MTPAEVEARARTQFGDPNPQLSNDRALRYGRRGSLVVALAGAKAGLWYDHERLVGGTLARPGEPNAVLPSERRRIRYDAELEAKLARVIEHCSRVDGMELVERYLASRGITKRPLPHSIRRSFNPDAMAALAQDEAGGVRAVQLTYLDHNACKQADRLGVVKRTYKGIDDWCAIAAVCLPGHGTVILCEGVETGLSVWQATGRTVYCCLGMAGIKRLWLRPGRKIVIARDNDPPGSPATVTYRNILDQRAQRHPVLVMTPPLGLDWNDVLVRDGEGAIRAALKGAEPWTISPTT